MAGYTDEPAGDNRLGRTVVSPDGTNKLPVTLFLLTELLLPGDSTLPMKCSTDDMTLSPLASVDALLEQGKEDFLSFLPTEFIALSPPQTQDYHFGLEEGEGISELFDCDFGDFTSLDF